MEYSKDHEIGRDFRATDDVVEAFKEFLRKREFEWSQEEWDAEADEYIRMGIERDMMAKAFGQAGSYEASLRHDNELNRVMEMLEKAPSLDELFAYAEKLQKEQEKEKKVEVE
jgi:nucleoside-diphosphate-sugar epimerase